MITPDLSSALLKCLQEIYSANPEYYFEFNSKLWTIFEEMGKFITSDFYLNQLCSLSSGSKMINQILEILKEIYLKNQTYYNLFDDNKSLEKFLNFLNMVLKSSRSAEGIFSISNPQKHLLDEKSVFDFIEELRLKANNQGSCNIYHDFLLGFIKYDLSDLHTEAHCRKSLEILEKFYLEKNADGMSLNELVIKLIKETSYLCCLRNKNEYVTVLIKNNKLPQQLWHFTVNQLIKILKCVLCKTTTTKTENNESEKKESQEESKLVNNNEVWEATITCFENIFKQSEGGYKNINRNLIEDLLKSCQEMEVLVINFIVNDLLPHSLKLKKEKQIKLLNLLDLGCNFDSSTISFNSTQNSNISKVCIENLFDLCRFKEKEDIQREFTGEDFEEYMKIKVKIAKMSTPILLKRCKEIFKVYFDEEMKQGIMPLNMSRKEDLKYVLESLISLDVYPNYHLVEESEIQVYTNKSSEEITIHDAIMRSKKSHLFTLMPFFSEFISCKDNEIKSIVKDIFKLINLQIKN